MEAELDNDQLRIVETVRKLLALAGNNPNENEAAAASAKAMELLAAYNLDMALVSKPAAGKRGKEKRKGGLYQWQRDLWRAVAKLNFCLYETRKGTYRGQTFEHELIGRKENVIGTELMATYLQDTVERLTRDEAKARGYNIFAREMIAYREGMATRLEQRLEALRQQKLKEERDRYSGQAGSGDGRGLVLASVLQSEHDANLDVLYGYPEGHHAQRRAESAARQAEAERRAQEALEAARRWAEENPEEAERIRLAKLKEEYETAERRIKEETKRAKRRKQPVIRERSLTAAEQRARLSTYGAGFQKGGEINLDRQIDKSNRGLIK